MVSKQWIAATGLVALTVCGVDASPRDDLGMAAVRCYAHATDVLLRGEAALQELRGSDAQDLAVLGLGIVKTGEQVSSNAGLNEPERQQHKQTAKSLRDRLTALQKAKPTKPRNPNSGGGTPMTGGQPIVGGGGGSTQRTIDDLLGILKAPERLTPDRIKELGTAIQLKDTQWRIDDTVRRLHDGAVTPMGSENVEHLLEESRRLNDSLDRIRPNRGRGPGRIGPGRSGLGGRGTGGGLGPGGGR